jgi:hypothetical protein
MSRKLFIIAVLSLLLMLPMSVMAKRIIVDPNIDISANKTCGMPAFHKDSMRMLSMKRAGLLPSRASVPEWGPKAVPALGSTQSFWTYDKSTWVTTIAELVKITADAYIYVQTVDTGNNTVLVGGGGVGAGYITQTDADDIALEFSNIYSTNRSVFGNEPALGIDGDSHVTILLLDIDSTYDDYLINGTQWWTASWTAGYFFSADTFTDASIQPANHSNERKIIYIDTYPTIEHGSYDFGTSTMDPIPTTDHSGDLGGTLLDEGAGASYATLAHEFQHMIHYEHDPDEETWVNEGCSGFAEFITGNGIPGAVGPFIANSSDSLTAWGSQVIDYGNTFLFMLYLYEQLGSVNSTITGLVQDTANGTTGVSNALGATTFSDFFKDWLIANYFDDTTLAPQYGYTNVTISNYSTGDTRDGIDPETPVTATTGSGSVEAMAARYYAIDYADMQYINFIGAGFAPMVAGLNGTTVVSGSIEDIATDTWVMLPNFGAVGASSYQSMIMIAANTSIAGSSFSYEFAVTPPSGGGGGGGGGCFIATASYDKASGPSVVDAIILRLRGMLADEK